jgi:hypothetical protein
MEPTPPEAELDELQTLTAAVTREHLIVLCCGQSVVELVDEVARNLRGLGFAVEVVCGAEARTALLGRSTGGNEPTIYVVCVQGTLKEQVLKPLRQALATHGGPNQHLFVAVLDLSLPLAMVGQIRRFAEALERPRRRGTESPQERRQWREQLGPNSERVATRSYRALEVVGRAESGPMPAVDAVRRTGPQAVIGSGKPAKIGVTSKYRAITGSLPVTAQSEAPTSERRRRRAHAPKVRVKPIAEPRTSPPPPPPATEVRSRQTGDTVVAPPPTAPEVTSSTTTTQIPTAAPVAAPTVAPAPPRIVATPPVGIEAPIVAPPRSSLPLVLGGIGIAAAIGAGLWFGGVIPRGETSTTTPKPVGAAAKREVAEPTPTPTAKAEPTPEPVAPPPAGIATPKAEPTPPAPPPETNATPPIEPTPTPATPEATPKPTPADIDPAFADAVASRRLRTTDHLYVTAFVVDTGTWQAARKACDNLEVGGKGGFRLPHRRELQGIEAAGWLDREPHWSRTVPDDDKESAYVIHPSTGQLTVWLKDETAAAVCVHPR